MGYINWGTRPQIYLAFEHSPPGGSLSTNHYLCIHPSHQVTLTDSDVSAEQLDDGRYFCHHTAFYSRLMYLHLQGKITLGAYLLDQENRARFTVLDADNEVDFRNLLKAYEDLKRQNIPSYLESSRRGGHMWLFFGNPIPGEKAKGFGKGIAKAYNLGKTEVFPKQSSVTNGPGSLIRMPFGIHKKTGHRYPFVTLSGEPIGDYRYQLEVLCHPEAVPKEALDMFQYKEPRIRRQFTGGHNKLTEIPLMEFLAQYVDLRPTASGAIGYCPFHDDQQPSFGVNAKGNYWNCFAGCGGGDIVKFWMKFKNLEYPTAVKDLEEMLYGHST